VADAAAEVEREARAESDGFGEEGLGSPLEELGHEGQTIGFRVALAVGVDGLLSTFDCLPLPSSVFSHFASLPPYGTHRDAWQATRAVTRRRKLAPKVMISSVGVAAYPRSMNSRRAPTSAE
jgi:hypothetical protein